MGATERLSIPVEETPSVDPNQVTEGNTETTETVEATETQSNRAEWLPEKFESAEDLAKAYNELESKLGSTDVQEVSELATAEQLQEFSNNYAQNGELSEEDYQGLSNMGISRDVVDSYIQGQMAIQDAEVQTIYGEVGGEKAYGDMMQWASQNLSPEEVAVYDEAVQSGEQIKVMSAVRGLKARHSQTVGNAPKLVKGNTSGNATNAYDSLDQMKRDMQNPLYRTDPAFRKQVEQKLAVSNIF